MTEKVYLNGEIVDVAEARISIFDHGFLYGDGIYETLRAYGGKVFGMDEHLRRLARSASMIGLRLPLDAGGVRKAVTDTLGANGLEDAYIRITVSRGPGPIGLDPALCATPTFAVMVIPHRAQPPEFYLQGVQVVVAKTRRNAREALNPMIKSLNFLNNIQAKREAIEAGAFEALMCNVEGYLAEGTVTNLFFVRDAVLFTPSLEVGLLDGITRGIILEAAGRLGVPVEEGRYREPELLGADEAFLSNSIVEVVPITVVNGRALGSGAVGPITEKVMSAYRTVVDDALAVP